MEVYYNEIISSLEIIKILKSDGWLFHKANGSHHHYKHPVKKGKVTIPHPKKDIPFKTAKSIFQHSQIKIK